MGDPTRIYKKLMFNPKKRLENFLTSKGAITIFEKKILTLNDDCNFIKVTNFLKILTEFQKKNQKKLNEINLELKKDNENLFIPLNSMICILTSCGLQDFRFSESIEKVFTTAKGKEMVSMSTIYIDNNVYERNLTPPISQVVTLKNDNKIVSKTLFEQTNDVAKTFSENNIKEILACIIKLRTEIKKPIQKKKEKKTNTKKVEK